MRDPRSLRTARTAAFLSLLWAAAPSSAQDAAAPPPQPSAPPAASGGAAPAPVPSTAAPAAPAVSAASVPARSPLVVTWKTDDPACAGGDVSARALRMVTPGVAPQPLRATVEVQRDGDQWLVRLATQGVGQERGGRRVLRAESCEDLEQAIALLLAMTLESKDEVVLPPAVVPLPPSASELPPEDEEPAPPPPVEAGVELGGFLRVDGRSGVWLLPGLSVGTGVAAGVRVGRFDLGVGAAYWTDSREPVRERDAFLAIHRKSVGLRGCYNAPLGYGFVLAPCLAPEWSFLSFESINVSIPRKGSIKPLASLTGSADLRYELVEDTLSLVLGAALTLERRQPFVLALKNDNVDDIPTESEQVYETKGLGPRLEIGVDARF